MAIARDARRIEVGVNVAGAAAQTGRAVPLGAAHDGGLMRPHAVGLQWMVTIDVAVYAARVSENLAGLLEQGYGARTRIGD